MSTVGLKVQTVCVPIPWQDQMGQIYIVPFFQQLSIVADTSMDHCATFNIAVWFGLFCVAWYPLQCALPSFMCLKLCSGSFWLFNLTCVRGAWDYY